MCGSPYRLSLAGLIGVILSRVDLRGVNRGAGVVLKAGERRVVTTPFKAGKLQIAVVIDF